MLARRRSIALGALLIALSVACAAGQDRTWLGSTSDEDDVAVETPELAPLGEGMGDLPPAPRTDAALGSSSRSGQALGADAGPANDGARAAPGVSAADAGPVPDAAPAVVPLPLPCTLRVDWEPLQSSRDGCVSLSDLYAATEAVWDGQVLVFGGESWSVSDGVLERLRRCPRGGDQLWRFGERLTPGADLPASHCPAEPVSVSYAYSECPLINPGTVCAANEPNACSFSGQLTLTPVPREASVEAFEPLPAEASCRPLGSSARRPLAAGERCHGGECAAGHYCAQELDDGGCAPIGEGVCAPAPSLAECGTEAEAVCLCTSPPVPLERVGPFRPEPAGLGLTPNACTARALGISAVPCPLE